MTSSKTLLLTIFVCEYKLTTKEDKILTKNMCESKNHGVKRLTNEFWYREVRDSFPVNLMQKLRKSAKSCKSCCKVYCHVFTGHGVVSDDSGCSWWLRPETWSCSLKVGGVEMKNTSYRPVLRNGWLTLPIMFTWDSSPRCTCNQRC